MSSNINLSLKYGDIPEPMRLGSTTPLHKKEAAPDKTIDRPVCIIKPLHKLFE